MGGDGLDDVKIPLLQSTDENVVVRTVTFQISDIKCTSCVNSIESALANLSGVKSIAVSSLDGRAAVKFVPKLITAKRIKESIEESGFKVNEVHDHDQDVSVCRIRIKGMACTSCSESVEKALQMVDGVKRAIVGLALEEAKVNYDPSFADPGKIIEAIEDAGFGGELISFGNDVNKVHLKLEGIDSEEDANLSENSYSLCSRSYESEGSCC